MDHFESILTTLLEADGYWVRQSYKVNLTPEEKRRIGKPSIPRPELDLLALDFKRNALIALEAKSFLDSPGVKFKELALKHTVPEGRYKLFTCARYREVVAEGLLRDLMRNGMVNQKTKLHWGLAAGKVYRNEVEQIAAFMESKGWFFWSPEDIRRKVQELASQGYENNAAIITAKILLR